MRTLRVLLLIGGLGLSLAACETYGPPPPPGPPRWVWPGPDGGCPPGYSRAPSQARCWLNGYAP